MRDVGRADRGRLHQSRGDGRADGRATDGNSRRGRARTRVSVTNGGNAGRCAPSDTGVEARRGRACPVDRWYLVFRTAFSVGATSSPAANSSRSRLSPTWCMTRSPGWASTHLPRDCLRTERQSTPAAVEPGPTPSLWPCTWGSASTESAITAQHSAHGTQV